MHDEIFWGALSMLLATLQYIPYVHGILAGRVKPHIFTWLVWALPTGVTFFAQITHGAGPGSWAMGYTTLLCALVCVLSLKRGEKQIVTLDWIMLGCALLAIVLWLLTSNALIAVLLSMVAANLGWVPTIRKSIHKPYEESITSYAIAVIKWLCSIVALRESTPVTLIFPATAVFVTILFIGFIMIRRAQLRTVAKG